MLLFKYGLLQDEPCYSAGVFASKLQEFCVELFFLIFGARRRLIRRSFEYRKWIKQSPSVVIEPVINDL